MTTARTEGLLFLAAVALVVGIVVVTNPPQPGGTLDVQPRSESRSYNGTLQGRPGAPANWTLDVTVAPGVHEIQVSASWHRAGPAIHLEILLPNGTRVPGFVPGNYPFSTASVHPTGARLQVILHSEVIEAFQVKVTQTRLNLAGT